MKNFLGRQAANQNYSHQPPSGFTLVEIMVTLGLTVLIMLLIITTHITAQGAYQKTDSRAFITQNGRVILDRLVREIRQTPDIATAMPATYSDPENLPSEIFFQDGHDLTTIKYIRYYLENTDLKRQAIAYAFANDPDNFVRFDATNQDGQAPVAGILEDKIIGEYVYDLEFWGANLVNINLYLLKGQETEILNTAVYGRNL